MKTRSNWAYIILVIVLLLCGCEENTEDKSDSEMQNIVFAVQNGCSDFLRTTADEFMAENSNVNIRIMELPGESSEVYRVLSSALAGEDVSLDVFVTEDVWLPEFVARGYVRDIDDLVSLDNGAYLPRVSESLYYNNKLYAVPIELDSGIMYYRKDLTDGLLSYKQLAEQSEIPYSVRTSDGEDMLCIVRECAALEGSTEKGLNLYKKLYESSSGETNDAIDDFRAQRVAYTRSWSEYNNSSRNRFQQLQSKVGVSVPKDENGCYMTVRAFDVAVKHNLNKDKERIASQFLNYLTSEQFQLNIARELGTLPMQTAYYDMPAVLDDNEYNEIFASYIHNLKFRPYREDYMICSRDAQEAVNDYLNGNISAEEAADAVNRIM